MFYDNMKLKGAIHDEFGALKVEIKFTKDGKEIDRERYGSFEKYNVVPPSILLEAIWDQPFW